MINFMIGHALNLMMLLINLKMTNLTFGIDSKGVVNSRRNKDFFLQT